MIEVFALSRKGKIICLFLKEEGWFDGCLVCERITFDKVNCSYFFCVLFLITKKIW